MATTTTTTIIHHTTITITALPSSSSPHRLRPQQPHLPISAVVGRQCVEPGAPSGADTVATGPGADTAMGVDFRCGLVIIPCDVFLLILGGGLDDPVLIVLRNETVQLLVPLPVNGVLLGYGVCLIGHHHLRQ